MVERSDTTGKSPRVRPHPGAMPETRSLGNRDSGIAPGCNHGPGWGPVVSLALNHRLISEPPPRGRASHIRSPSTGGRNSRLPPWRLCALAALRGPLTSCVVGKCLKRPSYGSIYSRQLPHKKGWGPCGPHPDQTRTLTSACRAKRSVSLEFADSFSTADRAQGPPESERTPP